LFDALVFGARFATAPPQHLRAASFWLDQINWDLTPFMF
jgi:hypothetical protein